MSGRRDNMSKPFWQKGKRKHAAFKGQRKSQCAEVEKAKSNEPGEAEKIQTIQGRNISISLGNGLGTEQPSNACKEHSFESS